MKDYDIYSLFGNALDNAIEYVLNLEEEKRFIRLNVKIIGENLLIHMENYFSGELIYDNGLPKTTKEDKDYHGYGMKSIQLIVNKYDGDLNISLDNNVFSLFIMFPIK